MRLIIRHSILTEMFINVAFSHLVVITMAYEHLHLGIRAVLRPHRLLIFDSCSISNNHFCEKILGVRDKGYDSLASDKEYLSHLCELRNSGLELYTTSGVRQEFSRINIQKMYKRHKSQSRKSSQSIDKLCREVTSLRDKVLNVFGNPIDLLEDSSEYKRILRGYDYNANRAGLSYVDFDLAAIGLGLALTNVSVGLVSNDRNLLGFLNSTRQKERLDTSQINGYIANGLKKLVTYQDYLAHKKQKRCEGRGSNPRKAKPTTPSR